MSNSAWTGARPHIDESELLCRTGCGYYGNPMWDGHCSKCYKELMQKNQQRKTVFDPTQKIRNKVSRSVSDVSELTSSATSIMSKKFDRFEEKRRQQLDKKTKAVKSIFRKSQVIKDPNKSEQGKATRQLSFESKSVTRDFKEFLKTLNKDMEVRIVTHINSFVDKMLRCVEFQSADESGEQVHEFYNSMDDLVSRKSNYPELTQEQIDRVNELTERYVTTRLYKALINVVNAVNEEKDLAIQNRIRSLAWVSSQHLECGVDETNDEVRETLDLVINELIEVNSKRVPSDKLKCLVSFSHHALNLLKQSSGGAPASADDFLPTMIYCILQANPPLLHSNISYITNFAQQSSLQSGEAGYFFTNLCCAVAFIEKLTAESLGLTSDEFQRYMSGEALPPNALEGDMWLCEGMRIMQQNLKTLDDLQGRMDRLISESDSLVEEMEDLQTNFAKEVAAVLERTPLTIRPRRANIDEEVPASDLLPPPLTPQTLEGSGQSMSDVSCIETTNLSSGESKGAPLSPDILAAQQSLSFLQGLTDLDSGLLSTAECNSGSAEGACCTVTDATGTQGGQSLLDESIPTAMSSVPDLLNPFRSVDMDGGGSSGNTTSLPSVLDPTVSCTNPFSQSGKIMSPTIPVTPSVAESTSTASHVTSRSSSQDSAGADINAYSGFTVQGGKIPSIPCDTGHFPSYSGNLSSDPLSPPLEGPQLPLPPPLIPLASGGDGGGSANASSGGSTPRSSQRQLKKEDTIDKVYNVLGDIVQTFDNLL